MKEPMESSDIALISFKLGKKAGDPRSGRFAPEQTQYPLYVRRGGLQGRCGQMWKILLARGFKASW